MAPPGRVPLPPSVLELSIDRLPVSEKSTAVEELAPPGCTRLTLIEPKSGTTLWSEVRKTSNAQEKSKLLEGLHEAVDQQEKSHSK